jgi:hypothetical protein
MEFITGISQTQTKYSAHELQQLSLYDLLYYDNGLFADIM